MREKFGNKSIPILNSVNNIFIWSRNSKIQIQIHLHMTSSTVMSTMSKNFKVNTDIFIFICKKVLNF